MSKCADVKLTAIARVHTSDHYLAASRRRVQKKSSLRKFTTTINIVIK
jgi:hypothetical protein